MKRRRRRKSAQESLIRCVVGCRGCGAAREMYVQASKMWRELFGKCQSCGGDQLFIEKIEE